LKQAQHLPKSTYQLKQKRNGDSGTRKKGENRDVESKLQVRERKKEVRDRRGKILQHEFQGYGESVRNVQFVSGKKRWGG
jgi:hypothetical protein